MTRKADLTGKAPATSEEAAAPGWLLFDFEPRIEELHYQRGAKRYTIRMATNQSDKEVMTTPLPELFSTAIESWTFTLQDGTVAPHTPEAISSLPSDVLAWLVKEWQTRRANPLVLNSNGSGKPSTSPPTGQTSPATAD